ncbi:hypothetical protein J6590_096273 [Homalodisca vitripennis]|nr:hypothetical protein J6590_096273 [Homalodisca vitripennis]
MRYVLHCEVCAAEQPNGPRSKVGCRYVQLTVRGKRSTFIGKATQRQLLAATLPQGFRVKNFEIVKHVF